MKPRTAGVALSETTRRPSARLRQTVTRGALGRIAAIKRRCLVLLGVLCLCAVTARASDELVQRVAAPPDAVRMAVNEPAVIPQPQSLTRRAGTFTLAPDCVIATDAASRETGKWLVERLRQATGYAINTTEQQDASPGKFHGGVIVLTTENATADCGAEGYQLQVTPTAVTIQAPTQAGLFYGAQTVLQLLPPEILSAQAVKEFNWQIPCVDITDGPRFPWRGLMLDVARHFFTRQEVENVLDVMALHKLNVFHWHLTDDQGWRIEIKTYPKLTAEGAWRDGVGFGLPADSTTAYGPDGRYGGCYSQDDIRAVLAYAAARHITVVPEIDMPGHSKAALQAYPEFGCSGAPGSNVYSPAKEETFVFLEGVLAEVFQLFPAKYIHIGGDEVPPGPWLKDPACQALMKRARLQTPAELECWFVKRIATFVNAHGKTLIGWSEIAHGGLPENAALMHYNGGGLEAASQGHDVVMAPTSYCYLNFYQSCDRSAEPHAFGGFIPLEKVYSFEPIPQGLAADKQRHILGAQGCLWGECIANLKLAEYMTFPRLSALAEVTWSPTGARHYDDFQRRLKIDEQRLARRGINYRSGALDNGTATIGVKVGEWKPAQIKAEPEMLEWDVTKKVTASGKVRVSLQFDYGSGIKSAWVALLEDGREISRDEHAGICRHFSPVARYTLDVPGPKAGAKYTLRAQIVGDGGSNSLGAVFWMIESANNGATK